MKINTMRILIADELHINQWHIEKIFNEYRCYCVCTVSSFNEVKSICSNRGVLIDLLVVNQDMVARDNIEFMSFFNSGINVREVLTYRCDSGRGKHCEGVTLRHMSHLPDNSSVRNILDAIEIKTRN